MISDDFSGFLRPSGCSGGYSGCSGFVKISYDFSGFLGISLDFSWISQDLSGFPVISDDFSGFLRISPDFSGPPGAPGGIPGAPDLSRFHRISPDFSGFHWIFHGFLRICQDFS